MVDYSKFLSQLLPWNFQYMSFKDIHLISLPPGRSGHTKESDLEGMNEDGTNLQLASKYTIFRRLNRALLHRSAERITFIQVRTKGMSKDMSQYIPVVDRLSKLDTIVVQRDEHIPEHELEPLVSFLNMFRAAFPRKGLQLNDMDTVRRVPVRTVRQLKGWRDRAIKFQQPTIKVYEALGRPYNINASQFPEFYTSCRHIDMSGLVNFHDQFLEARSTEEYQRREELLKSAVNLRQVDFHITEPTLFAGLASSTSGSPGGFLPNLSKLSLSANKSSLICSVLETALRCIRTLRSVKVRFISIPEEEPLHPVTLTLGDWDLPCIRALDIDMQGKEALIYLGSFDKCPLLTEVTIITSAHRAQDKANEGQGFKMPLAPIWHMPRLEKLTLRGLAALQFNHDSLASMCQLKLLLLTCESSGLILSSGSASGGDTEDNSMQEQLRYFEEEASIDTLPQPRTLHTEGVCSLLFIFDRLQRCPRLHSLHLSHSRSMHQQRLPLCWTSRNALTLPGAITNAPASALECTTSGPDIQPFYASQLTKICLQGPWVLSKDELLRLLTDYAPNLTTLLIYSRFGVIPIKEGDGIIKAVEEADVIHKARDHERKLVSVVIQQPLLQAKPESLNFVAAPPGWRTNSAFEELGYGKFSTTITRRFSRNDCDDKYQKAAQEDTKK